VRVVGYGRRAALPGGYLASRARILLGVAALGVLAASAAVTLLYLAFVRDLPDFRSLADYRPALTSVVLDRHGTPIGEFYEFRRRVIPLEEVPKHVIQAFLAAEDDSFYEHSGVDYVSIARAAWSNLVSGGRLQGASTITQQTVKQLLLSPERTYRRKIRELVLARRLEQRFSKDEILFLYLNEIYFGSGAYGIAEAARTYFGKEVSELSVSEAALLAGMPKAPGRFSPHVNPERAEKRRRWVVDRMLEEGFIDAAAHGEAQAPPALVTVVSEANLAASYFTENVRRRLVALLGNEVLLHGGLVIETTLDARLQREAVLAVRRGLEAYDQRHGWRGALRRVKAAELEAEIVKIGEENGLAGGADPTTTPLGPPRLGVVTGASAAAGEARIALAPDVEARFAFADAKWAQPEKNLSLGDVAHFRVSRGANDQLVAVLYQQPEVQGALLAIDLRNDDVLALVGGYDFAASELDRATQSLRQPGSAFKPIVYATALAHGMTPASIVMDTPVVYENFRPENYGRKFLGALTLAEALARSVNNAAVHLLEEVGIDRAIGMARRLGIRSELEPGLALALGASSVSLLELTRAYAVLGAGGRHVEPRMVVRVLDREGQVLLEDVPLDELGATADAEGPEAEVVDESGADELAPEPVDEALPEGFVLPPAQAYIATSLLRAPIEHPAGTGHAAAVLGRPLAGKTGTTNDHTDAWFVGYSPEIAAGVWLGFDQNRLLGKGETGGRAALPIWLDFMRPALADRPPRDFRAPPGVVFARIDAKTGGLASPSSESTLFQAFLEGTEPVQAADTSAGSSESLREIELGF
jgi:penicillin-binding protein 1A